MRTLICGSIAYDNIMVFRGRFREHILPEQIHILNVAFLVPSCGASSEVAQATSHITEAPGL